MTEFGGGKESGGDEGATTLRRQRLAPWRRLSSAHGPSRFPLGVCHSSSMSLQSLAGRARLPPSRDNPMLLRPVSGRDIVPDVPAWPANATMTLGGMTTATPGRAGLARGSGHGPAPRRPRTSRTTPGTWRWSRTAMGSRRTWPKWTRDEEERSGTQEVNARLAASRGVWPAESS